MAHKATLNKLFVSLHPTDPQKFSPTQNSLLSNLLKMFVDQFISGTNLFGTKAVHADVNDSRCIPKGNNFFLNFVEKTYNIIQRLVEISV